MVLRWLGHSTVLVELDSACIITDPLLRARVAHLRRVGPRPVLGPTAPDAVLISHAHHDHLDLPSLKLLPGTPELIVPRGLRQLLSDRGFDRVREVTPGDEIDVARLTIRVTHAEHEGNRAGSSIRVQPVGYALLGTTRVFFAGDTDLFPELEGLVPDLDLALLPIWGWGASLGSGHLDPLRAAEALALLRPRIAIPIHWGSLRPLHRRPGATFLRAPVEAFVAAASRLAPQVDVRVLAPGEACVLH